MYYPSIMGSQYFEFPISKGEICNIFKIPKCGFSYGIYNVEVISNDQRFNKIFAFSKDNYYTHFSLNFIINYYNKKFNGNIQLTLLSNECLKYKDKNMVIQSSKIFSRWYKILEEFKLKFLKNKLIKKLSSTAWGHLQKSNIIIKTQEEILNENLDYGNGFDVNKNKYYLKKYDVKGDGTELFNLIDLTKPIYTYQLRLKSFLTSYARTQMALIGLKHIDHIVRIQTDSITYDIPLDIKEYKFIKEDDKSNIKAEIRGNSILKL